jgi:hypothetical protein
LAYVFDPINNTLIDDEDKSLGNKFAVLDPDLEKVLQELNERFGPGTIQEGTQGIPQPPIKTPQAIFEFEERMKGRMADGGAIGGGIITGEDYGNRTNFAEPKLIIGSSRTPPQFKGMYAVRTGLTVPADTPGYLGRTGENAVFATETDAQRFIDEDIKKLFLESQASKKRSPVLEARLEKIKQIYKNLKASGAKKIYLDDILDQLEGEKSVFGTGKRGIQTEQTQLESRSNFRDNIKEALGKKIYDTLIKSPAADPRITDAKKAKFNKLVLDVNRGDLPILALGSEARGTKQNIKMYLTEANTKRFDKLLPLLRAVNSRITQPRQKYTADDIKNISETTVKTFNKMTKNYPISIAARTNVFKGGTRSFDAKSYILAQLGRHVENGGQLFKHIGGDTIATVKFRDLNTNKIITYRNMDLNNPLFKEAATVYNDIEKLKDIKIDDPRNPGKTITLNKALQEGGDKLVIDHLDEVQNNPLKKLVISTQKANMSGQIKDLTQPEIDAIGRGLNLSFVDNLKRYKKYAERILVNKAANPEFKIKSPTETIKEKTGTFRGEAQNIKSKMDNFKFLTNRIPGGAVVLSPVDFTLSMFAGLPLTESLASAGSYLIKDPYLGKAVNVPLAIAADIQDPEGMMERAGTRQEKFKNILEGITGIDQDEPLLDELREKFSNMEAGDQPDIDPFQAAEGGRAGFSNGGAAGADDNFLKELEFYFTNEDAELPKLQTYKETMNPVEILNDIIDPRNYPYYADVLARSGLRIGEFAVRILPATGKLVADAIQKGPFKVTGTGSNYVQDYTDVLPSNIEGTGIFSEFLKNITPTATEKFVGLDKLIEKEEQKQIERGSTAGPKVFADTIGLGAEVTAPIFPGLKLLNSFAKARNLPNDKATQKILEKEVDKVLSERGMTRREFLQMTGASATVVMAKMLGLMDIAPKATKVVRAAPIMDNTVEGMPTWFKEAVYAIERKGLLKSRGDIKGIEPDFFEITLNTKLGPKRVLMSKNDRTGEITLDWTTDYYDTDIPVTITYKPGLSGKQNFLSDPEIPRSVEKYDVEVEAPEFEYRRADVESMGPEDTSFDSSINLDIKEEADAVVEALEELGLGLSKKQKKDAAENFRYYNDIELDEGSGPGTQNPIDESDAYTFIDMIKRNRDK